MAGKPIDKARLQIFLQRLGEVMADHPGVVFLLGGSALTWLTVKAISIDIDVSLAEDEPDPIPLLDAIVMAGDFVEATADVVRIADLLPLPEGYAERAIFAGQFGRVSVYCFDPYSIALTKLARSANKDVRDVSAMLRAGLVECSALHEHFESVLLRYQQRASRADWQDFKRKVETFYQRHCG